MDNTQIKQRNDDGMSAIYNGILYAINQGVKDAPYDKTLIGLVTNVNLETNTYTVIINGCEYNNVMSMIRAYINDTVVIMCPQNQLSQMFIYGKIDTTDYSEE
jgi:hypothetical protein